MNVGLRQSVIIVTVFRLPPQEKRIYERRYVTSWRRIGRLRAPIVCVKFRCWCD